MKKKLLILCGIIAIITLGLGVKFYLDSRKQEEEMLTIVKSEEAKDVFEEGLKKLDPKAFTTGGVIQSYEIDEESVKKNPMGGIMVKLIVNDDDNLTIDESLNKSADSNLESSGSVVSRELDDILIVHSGEAKNMYENLIKEIDKNGLTTDGSIKTYKIDFQSIKSTTQQKITISTNLIINDNPELKIEVVIGNIRVKNGKEKFDLENYYLSEKLSQIIEDGRQNK